MSTAATAAAPSNPLDDHLGYQLRRASTVVMAALAQRLAAVELTVVETSVLILIDQNPGIFQSEIGRILGIKRANMAPLAATLRRRGLVSTASEGRLVGFATTPEGHALASDAERIMRDNDALLFEALPAAARATLGEALSTVWRHRLPAERSED